MCFSHPAFITSSHAFILAVRTHMACHSAAQQPWPTAATFLPLWLACAHISGIVCDCLFTRSHTECRHAHLLLPHMCCIMKLWKTVLAIDNCDEMLKGFIYFRKETVQDEGFMPRCLLSCHKWRGFLLPM